MELRKRLETAGAIAAVVVCVAFVVSFAFGLRGDPDIDVVDLPGAVVVEEVGNTKGRVEVLNASGKAGLARAATDRLRSGGFDVIYFGNAPASAGDSSAVIVRTGVDRTARAAAEHLGIARVRTERADTLYVDATVIIGKDWPPVSERKETGEESWGARLKRWVSPGS